MDLIELAKQFPATDKNTKHTYLPTYIQLFTPYQDRPITILELGVQVGHSLLLWQAYFPQAEVHGADFLPLPPAIQDVPRIHYHQIDLDDPNQLATLTANTYDIIIDDASHKLPQQISNYAALFPCLNLHGLYIIEDALPTTHQSFPHFQMIDLRHMRRRYDNILLVQQT